MLTEHLIKTLQYLATQKDYNTDKNTTHSYLELYDQLMAPYAKGEINLLEIGNHQGGSLLLWNDYFENAELYGLEINTLDSLKAIGEAHEKIHLKQGVDAYMEQTVTPFLKDELFFDIIIDDGSHQPMHQMFVINTWYKLLKPGGTMIIEDVASPAIASLLLDNAKVLKPDDRVAIFDRRNVKGQSDDIVVVLKKGRK